LSPRRKQEVQLLCQWTGKIKHQTRKKDENENDKQIQSKKVEKSSTSRKIEKGLK